MNEQLRMAIPVLWPAMAVAACIMLAAWWPRWNQRSGVPREQPVKGWASALALGLAFAAAFCRIINGLPTWPPPEKWQWLLPIAVLAGGCGVVAGLIERPAGVRWAVAILSAGLTAWAFHPIASIGQPLLWRIGVAAAMLLTWACLEGSARRHRGFLTPLLLSMLFAGVSIVILQGKNANISLLAASTSAALGATCMIALLLTPLSLAGGATYILSALLPSMTAIAWMYAIGAPPALAILAVTPLILRGGELISKRASGWKSMAIRFACTVVPVAGAVIIAAIDAARQSSEFG